MGKRIRSWFSALRRKLRLIPTRKDVDRSALKSADATDNAPHYQLGLPLEIWMAIIDVVASDDAGRRHLVPLTRVCKDLNYVAEEALYRRVSVGPRLSQLCSFLHAVFENDRRAAAVRALRMQVPGVTLGSVRSTGSQKPVGLSTYTPAGSHYSVDPSHMDNLSDMIVQMFGRLVNLKELTYNDLQTLSAVFTCSSFQLTEFKTTGDALSKATSHLYSRTIGEESLAPSSPLLSVEKLTVDLFNPCVHLADLHLLSVTHLALDRCFFHALPDLRRSLSALPNLLSLWITWSAVNAQYGTSALWPTHILGDSPAPRLQRLELCEWKTQRAFEPLNVDLDEDVDSHLKRIRHSCPNMTSLVWMPSDYHRQLAAGSESKTRFRKALRRYSDGIFTALPKLESFERPNLEVDGGFRTFVRGEDGRVSDQPSQYRTEGWKSV